LWISSITRWNDPTRTSLSRRGGPTRNTLFEVSSYGKREPAAGGAAAGSGRVRMLRSSGDDRSQTQRGGMGWREAPDHARVRFLTQAAGHRPKLLSIRTSVFR